MVNTPPPQLTAGVRPRLKVGWADKGGMGGWGGQTCVKSREKIIVLTPGGGEHIRFWLSNHLNR